MLDHLDPEWIHLLGGLDAITFESTIDMPRSPSLQRFAGAERFETAAYTRCG